MHQSAGLVHRNERERYAEHHRRQSNASFDNRARRIESGDALAARAVVACRLKVLDDGGLCLEILHRLAVRRLLEPGPQQVGFAHVERIEAAFAGDGVHRALNGDHPLRAAKAAKGSVGDGVCLQAPRADRRVRQPVTVASVKHRAVDNAGRKIGGAAAARVEHHFVAGDDAPVVIADAPVGPEIMALAGQHEVVVAIEANLAGRPVTRAASAAIAAQVQAWLSLPPNPPPIRRVSTVTKASGTPRTRATICCVSVGSWLEACTIISSPSPGMANEAWPSR